MELCQIFLFLFLFVKVLAFGGFLNPNSPVRKIGEFLLFDCRSPTDYVANNLDITVYILHNDTMLGKVSHSILQNFVAKAEYKVTDIDAKSAGKWECTISDGMHFSFHQDLIVIEGDSSPAVLEMNRDGKIDCLTNIDKTRPINVEWLVDNKSAYGKFRTDGFLLKVSNISVEDRQKNFSCVVKARNSSGTQDESSYTRVNKPVSLVRLEKCAETEKCSFKVRVCGWTNMSISWYINSTFIHGSTERTPDTISDCEYYSIDETNPGLQVCIGDMKTTNLWCKNMSDIEQEGSSTAGDGQSAFLYIVIGVVTGVVVIVTVTLIIVIVQVCKKRNQHSKKKDLPSLYQDREQEETGLYSDIEPVDAKQSRNELEAKTQDLKDSQSKDSNKENKHLYSVVKPRKLRVNATQNRNELEALAKDPQFFNRDTEQDVTGLYSVIELVNAKQDRNGWQPLVQGKDDQVSPDLNKTLLKDTDNEVPKEEIDNEDRMN